MISKNVKVEVALREEDRPIAFLVQMASQFESKILFETGNKQVNVKSMMGMMSLGLDLDRLEDLTVVADGVDEEEAVSKIECYLTKGAQIHISVLSYMPKQLSWQSTSLVMKGSPVQVRFSAYITKDQANA